MRRWLGRCSTTCIVPGWMVAVGGSGCVWAAGVSGGGVEGRVGCVGKCG